VQFQFRASGLRFRVESFWISKHAFWGLSLQECGMMAGSGPKTMTFNPKGCTCKAKAKAQTQITCDTHWWANAAIHFPCFFKAALKFSTTTLN
jgi:hypothetical protein